MSIFNKALASIGIGAATVDTRLASMDVQPGGTLSGQVHVQGGNTSQAVGQIFLALMTKYSVEFGDDDRSVEYCLAKVSVNESFEIGKGENRIFDFTMPVPLETPVNVTSAHSWKFKSKVWLKTSLDIDNAVDPSDSDYVRVQAYPLLEKLREAAMAMGLRPKGSEIEAVRGDQAPGHWRVPFAQEFEFAHNGQYSKVKEIEFAVFPHAGGMDVVVELDRRVKSLGDLFKKSEVRSALSFSTGDLEQPMSFWTDSLNQAILSGI